MKYSDEQRLQKIYEKGSALLAYIRDHDVKKDNLMNDTALQWLVTTPLSNIGEHAHCISDEYKDKHPEIQWNMIAGLRHRLVHDYDGTNWFIIADVVFDEMPVLVEQVKELI
ncbi:MAG: DUF86 domain-containing protein [Ruminiclostridium sp.]|nr:DUF86 domain-containing protein [Ruminiclostridium sp.]